jgi:hypothetical protein
MLGRSRLMGRFMQAFHSPVLAYPVGELEQDHGTHTPEQCW